MKIYKAEVGDKFRPDHQDFIWPPQNGKPGWDYGVEQDFEWWFDRQSELIAEYPYQADYLYVPIFWNRYYINTLDRNKRWGGGIPALVEEVERMRKYDLPMFTISEADIKWLKPEIDFSGMTVFMSSRRDENGGIDIPLLAAPHELPDEIPDKKWLASFMGNLKTDGIRIDMHELLKDRTDCRIEHAGVPSEVFVRIMLESYIGLSPRGQGAQSYRMYEAMQLGTVPLYLSDLDCRPFRNWLDWDVCSIYMSSVDNLNERIDELSRDKGALVKYGTNAKYTYDNFLSYGNWCKFAIKELELI